MCWVLCPAQASSLSFRMKFLRYFAASFIVVVFNGSLRSQVAEGGGIVLPENYFPALKGLIEVAVKQSPRMITRNTEEAIAENNRIIARAGQLPSLGGFFNYYPYDRQTRADLVGSTNVKKVGYNLSLNQPVYHWGALQNNTRIGKLQLKIAEGQTAEAYRMLVGEIRYQYMQLILKRMNLVRVRYNQKIQDDQLTLARTKLEKHIIADADIFGPTIYAEQARLAVDRAEEDYANAKIGLAKLAGSPPITDDQIPESIPAVTPVSAQLQARLDAFTAQRELDTNALRILRQQIEVERLNYEITKVRLRPKLSATIGISQDQQNYSLATNYKYQVRDVFAGVSVGWTIFDGFANGRYKANVLARRRQLERDYETQTADMVAAVRAQARQLDFNGRSLAIEEKFLASSANGVRVRRDDVARGLASESDVTAAQFGLYDTQFRTCAARSDYILGVASLLSLINADPALDNLPKHK